MCASCLFAFFALLAFVVALFALAFDVFVAALFALACGDDHGVLLAFVAALFALACGDDHGVLLAFVAALFALACGNDALACAGAFVFDTQLAFRPARLLAHTKVGALDIEVGVFGSAGR